MTTDRKKLLYRSKHRGTKEIDTLLGNFAQDNLHALTDDEISQYKKIIDIDDNLIYQYLVGNTQFPMDLSLFRKIIDYNKLAI